MALTWLLDPWIWKGPAAGFQAPCRWDQQRTRESPKPSSWPEDRVVKDRGEVGGEDRLRSKFITFRQKVEDTTVKSNRIVI